MKTLSIIAKSLKEQLRSYWILLLSLSMGPFFIFVYFLIVESSQPEYKVLILNNDSGVLSEGQMINHGDYLTTYFKSLIDDTIAIPLTVSEASDRISGIESLKNNKADALIVIDPSFSQSINKRRLNDSTNTPVVEIVGDLTSVDYLVSAVWTNEILSHYISLATLNKKIVEVRETPLGISSSLSNFDIIVPGILIVSLIMLMFTASIAFVSEVENKPLCG